MEITYGGFPTTNINKRNICTTVNTSDSRFALHMHIRLCFRFLPKMKNNGVRRPVPNAHRTQRTLSMAGAPPTQRHITQAMAPTCAPSVRTGSMSQTGPSRPNVGLRFCPTRLPKWEKYRGGNTGGRSYGANPAWDKRPGQAPAQSCRVCGGGPGSNVGWGPIA